MSHVPVPPPPARFLRGGWLPWAAVAAAVLVLPGMFFLGRAAHPGAAATATVTTTLLPSEPGATPPPPPPPPGSGKPVGSVVLPQSLDDFNKTRTDGGPDTVQAATYVRTSDTAAVRLVTVLRATNVAALTPPGARVTDVENRRCWFEHGLRTCASDVDGGVIVVTAAAGEDKAEETSAFLAALLRANA